MGVALRATLLLVLVLSSMAAPARAQQGPAALATALRGQSIEQVRIQAPPGEDADALLRLTRLGAGMEYDPAAVRRATQSLYRTGRFENAVATVRAGGQGLILDFHLPPRTRLSDVRFLALSQVGPAFVRRAIGLEPGAPIRPADLPELRARINLALLRAGWRQPAIGLALEEVDPVGGRALLVRVEPGPLSRVRNLVFVGDPRRSEWSLRSFFDVGPGDVLDLDRLDRAVKELSRDYRRQGHYDVKVAVDEIESVAPDTADLRVRIDAGPRIEVDILGNRRFPVRWLRAEAQLLQNQGTDASQLREVRDRMLDAMFLRGHYKAQIRYRVSVSRDGELRRIQFQVKEGPVGRIGRLRFPGRSAISQDRLEARYEETAERILARVIGQPGVDPRTVRHIGGGSSHEGYEVRAVDSTAPDPGAIYVARVARAAVDALANLYRSEGYQMVKVGRPTVIDRPDGLLDLAFPIDENVQWVSSSVSFRGNESFDSERLQQMAAREPGVEAGTPVAFEKVEEARRRLLQFYRDEGFLFVKIYDEFGGRGGGVARGTARDACADAMAAGRPTCDVDVAFTVVEGPLVTTDRILIRGQDHTKLSVIESEVVVEPDTILRDKDLQATRDRLLRVGVFDRVTVEPANPNRIESRKDVIVDVRERNRFGLEVGGGVSTEEGFRVFTSFSDNNFLGRAIRLNLTGRANYWPDAFLVLYNEEIRRSISDFYNIRTNALSNQLIDPDAPATDDNRVPCPDTVSDVVDEDGNVTRTEPPPECRRSFFERLEFQLSAGILYPRIFGLPRGFAAGLDVSFLRNLDPAFLEVVQSLTLTGAYAGWRPRIAGKERRVVFQIRGNLERSELDCNDSLSADDTQRALTCGNETDPNQPFRLERTTLYATVGPKVSFDLRNDTVDPSGGLFMEVESELAKGLNSPDDSPDFAKLEGRASFYFPLAKRVTLATALVGGRIWPLNRDDVPVNQKFFGGGRTTIRGYQENTLLPQDVELDPVTGLPLGAISAGGLLLIALKTELRFKVGGPVSLAAFYDVGDLFQNGRFSFSTVTELENGDTVTRRLAQGTGVGVRLATPVGALAVDLAVPVDVRPGEPNNPQIHFAVGTF